jgi:hypothetical protein
MCNKKIEKDMKMTTTELCSSDGTIAILFNTKELRDDAIKELNSLSKQKLIKLSNKYGFDGLLIGVRK